MKAIKEFLSKLSRPGQPKPPKTVFHCPHCGKPLPKSFTSELSALAVKVCTNFQKEYLGGAVNQMMWDYAEVTARHAALLVLKDLYDQGKELDLFLKRIQEGRKGKAPEG